jgi:Cu+-exporting ATPase
MAEEHRKKAELKISGMTCATCATAIEKSLLRQNGVAEVQVNLGNETAVVVYDSTKLKLADLEKAVTDAGYRVINEKVTLKIGGMTCATCVKTIEKSLKRLDGIIGVNVNLGAEKSLYHLQPANNNNS